VTPAANQADRARARMLLSVAMRRDLAPFDEIPPRLVLVDFDHQQAFLVEDGEATACYPVSTARDLGGEEGSNRTPPGWHRIHQMIGEGEPDGTIFVSREPAGETWQGQHDVRDLILTRVLTLEGLEDGINRGAGRDSLERYIYIHGTNHLGQLGKAVSHGCVRMAGIDVKDLFRRVREGDPVTIIGGAEPIA
jgi:UDP-N-acetylmuramate--alanine ligase